LLLKKGKKAFLRGLKHANVVGDRKKKQKMILIKKDVSQS
jgi:hypothetical protein